MKSQKKLLTMSATGSPKAAVATRSPNKSTIIRRNYTASRSVEITRRRRSLSKKAYERLHRVQPVRRGSERQVLPRFTCVLGQWQARKNGVTSICGIKDKSAALVPWALEEAAKHLFALNESGIAIDRAAIAQAVFASDDAKTKAADLGTAIHDWCERYIRNKLGEKGFETAPEMPEDPNVVTGVLSFLEWESAHA